MAKEPKARFVTEVAPQKLVLSVTKRPLAIMDTIDEEERDMSMKAFPLLLIERAITNLKSLFLHRPLSLLVEPLVVATGVQKKNKLASNFLFRVDLRESSQPAF
ncbi:hypothetical protein Acr_12g0001960 [Actinidia rufa]|uniref:Uncharacterized protein n=1 Tax=Actinidia rufa TaxID=165716 RepID=A0A7J0FG63_9ERIC|nr:hypothetical protein Acr_12g0001960 [Actinidia rufa]